VAFGPKGHYPGPFVVGIDARRPITVAKLWGLCYTFGGRQVSYRQTEASPLTMENPSRGGALAFWDLYYALSPAQRGGPDGGPCMSEQAKSLGE
jgi:hypothetical protein